MQIHAMDDDPWMEEDRAAAEALVEEVEGAELFIIRGRATCSPTRVWATTTSRLPRLLKVRTLEFLQRVGL